MFPQSASGLNICLPKFLKPATLTQFFYCMLSTCLYDCRIIIRVSALFEERASCSAALHAELEGVGNVATSTENKGSFESSWC